MINIVPYKIQDIKEDLKQQAINDLNLTDAEFESSNIAKLIDLLAYAITINNTNLTFGLNETILTEAQNRKNVIKLAKNLGYIFKRKQSYQYKIRLKSLNDGLQTLPKYTKFEGNGNTYNYINDDIQKEFGVRLYFNNVFLDVLNFVDVNDTITTIEGKEYKIIQKDYNNILVNANNEQINLETDLNQRVLIYDSFDDIKKRRKFKDIGEVLSYIYDDNLKEFNIQIKLNDDVDIKTLFYTYKEKNGDVINDNNIYYINLDEYIKVIKELKLINDNETIDIDVYSNAIEITNNKQVKINSFKLPITELAKTATQNDDKSYNIVTNNNIIDLRAIKFINKNNENDFIEIVDSNMFKYSNNNITLKPSLYKIEKKLDVNNKKIVLDDYINNIIYLRDNLGNDLTYTFTDKEITINEDVTEAYIEAYLIRDVNNYNVYVSYTYLKDDLQNYTYSIKYFYDKNADGYIDRHIYFSDFTGEYPENEYSTGENGFDGFVASDFDYNRNILTFKMNELNRYVNEYVNNKWIEGKYLNEVFKLKQTNKIIIDGIYYKINKIVEDRYIDIIVKEGIFKFYKDNEDLVINVDKEDVERGYIVINEDDVENDGVELFVTRILETGEVEREKQWTKRDFLLADYGNLNYENKPQPYQYNTEMEYLKALEIWKKNVYSETFTIIPYEDYTNYLLLYTEYAGAGIPLSEDMILHINLLFSKGSEGECLDLMTIKDNNFFEVVPFDDNINNILVFEGSDIEDTNSIKENAQKFHNTANRAVTKSDYMSICESLPFISNANVYGTEEMPEYYKKTGTIFFTFTPYSRDYNKFEYDAKNNIYSNKLDEVLYYPSYYEITGKQNYYADVSFNKSVFSLLEKYKIITLMFYYLPIQYINFDLDIEIFKYKYNISLEDSKKNIFDSILEYFKYIDNFETIFYKSTLIKYIDRVVGDDLGIKVNIKNYVNLKDSWLLDNSVFENITNNSLNVLHTDIKDNKYKGAIYNGYYDTFRTRLFFKYFDELLISDLPRIYNENFLFENDLLYSDYDNIKTYDNNDIEIPIKYKHNDNLSYENTTINRDDFIVGYIKVSKKYELIIIELYTHAKYHLYNSRVHINENTYDIDKDIKENVYIPNGSLFYLPRDKFIDNNIKLYIDFSDNNIAFSKNTYPNLMNVAYQMNI